MATTRTIKSTKKTSTTTSSASTSAKATEIPVEAKKEKRTFEPEELIPCVSVTPGELFMVGYKSHNLYSWADTDDVIGVEFRDLDYAVKARKPTISEPYIVVDDEDFLDLHPFLKDIYAGIYSINELKSILSLSPSQMERTIKALPEWAMNSFKTVVSSMIDDGSLDSIKKIKILDDIFDTEMLLKLTN